VIIMKARPADQPQGEPQWRVKCPDCPGKIYTLGPGETLDNFEAHAKYRTHTANVQQRIATHGS
jgi:SWI/SNF-related matrix-associated actin-dependent regulator of chromatin subfamily B protein 1